MPEAGEKSVDDENLFTRNLDMQKLGFKRGERRRLCEFRAANGDAFYLPELVGGLLYGHQSVGLRWLLNQFVRKKGAILADEMGLGKTMMALCLLASLKLTAALTSRPTLSGPSLIVCPATLQK